MTKPVDLRRIQSIHILLLLGHSASDAHFTVPRRVEVCMNG